METRARSRVAIACQGGGSHTAFSSGVLQGLLAELPEEVDVVGISGTSGGAICAALAWDGLVRGEPDVSIRKLRQFWSDVGAREPWDKLVNEALLASIRLREHMAFPEVSPYLLPTWGEERFLQMLREHMDFAELRELAKRPGAPALHIGAVEVLTGHFEVFQGHELTAECLLASAAIPQLFRAVHVEGKGMYWDGLFSQNPPIHDLPQLNINELWVIQINANTCARVPMMTHEIIDRQNDLSGNLSMEQELRQIDLINRLIAQRKITDPRFHPIHVQRLVFDRALDYSTKLDRWPDFLDELSEYGRSKARRFLKERASQSFAVRAGGRPAVGQATA
ncbi:patatin-like phospholipase family protein [Aquisphaera insulae]|uniref:patatin-like phospholipase family protein n=1 Tax=Aquisphaera insulae TaxID=2712864 RepID=UPI0013E9D598|nr:patatin-like phospholipase family protein [Aquisphaera insulae]